jgi:chitin disaccharide deacetylase
LTPTPALIVTADDFGFDASVNAAVVRSFDQGLVTHASLLVNLDGFQDACQLIAARGWQDRIGLHLNLTEGPAVTASIRKTAFCADGRFLPVNRFRYYRIISVETRRAVADEVAAQIAAARDAGIPLTHLDSHNDVHTTPSIARVVAEVAKAHGIPRVRLARNCGPGQGMIRWLYHRRFNGMLEALGLNRLEYFGSIDDLLWLREHRPDARSAPAEVMTHPRLTAGGVLVDAPATEPLALRIDELRRVTQ